MDWILKRVLRVPVDERPSVLLLLAYALLLASSYQASRTIADSLFLARLGTTHLPITFLLSGLLVAFVAWISSRLMGDWKLRSVSLASGCTFGCLSIAAGFLLPQYHHSTWLIGSIYLLTEIRGTINAIHIHWAMHDRLRQGSQYSFAAVGTAIPIAGIGIGTIMSLEAYAISSQTWLIIIGLLDIAAALLLHMRQKKKAIPLTSDATTLLPTLLSSKVNQRPVTLELQPAQVKYLRSLGLFFAIKFFLLTLVAFEWKRYVEDFYGTDESALTAYFSCFYATSYLLILVLQTFFAGRVLEHRGYAIPLWTLPVLLTICGLLLTWDHSAWAALALLTLAKSSDVWRRGIHDTAVTLLYLKVPRKFRRWSISRNTGMIKPLSEMVASLVILVLFYLSGDWILTAWLAASFAWLLVVPSILKHT